MDCIYKFEFPDRPPEEFVIFADTCSLEIYSEAEKILPAWTELAFHQCPHCLQDGLTVTHCPLSVSIAGVVDRFESLLSYDETTVTVTTDKRTYTCATTVQQGLSALMGMIFASSGCPHTAFLRPLTHFHLPVSDTDEVLYRVVGVYLIGQYFRQDKGQEPSFDLSRLVKLYDRLETVNEHILKRVRSAVTKDAPLNAIVLFDYRAKNTTMAIREGLDEIRHLWASYIEDSPQSA